MNIFGHARHCGQIHWNGCVRRQTQCRLNFSTRSSNSQENTFATRHLPELFALERFPQSIKEAATSVYAAREQNRQIEPLTNSDEFRSLDQSTAYDIAAAECGLRLKKKATPIGRKIGFTNSVLWTEYGVDAPIWSYMYDSTVQIAERDQEIDLRAFSKLQPRIEPEIILGLSKRPSVDMGDEQLLSCVGWIAHGFEVVVSLFPDWKFKAADTIAASALHGCLVLGPKHHLHNEKTRRIILSQLPDFTIHLRRNGSIEAVGKGSNVLGGPILALRHLIKLLAAQNRHPELEAGEMISTGTLTSALLIADGNRWHTNFEGIPLPGLDVRFKLK